MAKFKCKICGYVTDEFDELPEDYKCPMCGASADMFEEVEQGKLKWLLFVKFVDTSTKQMNYQKVSPAQCVVQVQKTLKNNKFLHFFFLYFFQKLFIFIFNANFA